MKASIFIFGLGYTAQFLSSKLSQLGFQIVGTTRNRQNSTSENQSDFQLMNFSDLEIERYLSQATHILICIPPMERIGDVVLFHYIDWIKRASSHLKWLGYLSSTGVYGHHEGQWVDESALCHPLSKSGILRLEAEQAWMSVAIQYQLPLHVFRLAGIYGPRRNAIERVAAGKKYSIYKEGQVFSRIHVDDIVAVILASIQNPNPLSIYNVADDEPAPSHVVDAYASHLLKTQALPLLPFERASLSTMEKEFYANNRRVSNLKIKEELQVVLQYPSFREGLNQLHLPKNN